MTSPLRVLHIVSALNRGGIECWLMNLLRLRHPELLFEFLVFGQGTFDEEAESLGAVIHRLPFRSPIIHRHLREIESVIAQGRYDAVHNHVPNASGSVLKIAEKHCVPVRIAHAHNTGWGKSAWSSSTWFHQHYQRFINRPKLRRYATDLLACSQEAGFFFFGRLWKARSLKEMVYCGIPTIPFDIETSDAVRRNLFERYGIPADSIVVGTIGRLNYQKNFEFLVNVFNVLQRRSDRYVLFIAGEGKMRRMLEEQVKTLGLQGNVFMPGVCNNIPELTCHLYDVFCLPSRWEGFGIVLIEAIAAGLHCICSDVISQDICNVLPSSLSTMSLSAPMEQWCDALEAGIAKRRTPREGAALLQRTPFSIENSMESLMKVYRSIDFK